MSKVLWIFESTKQAKEHLLSKNIDLYGWDRIIILWSEQTTHEWTGSARKNINGIFLVGKQWDPWVDGKNGKNGIDGKDWKDGKDGIWLDWKDWLDGIDGADGCSIHLVVSFDGIERNFGEKDIVIDYEKNIYFYRNNTVVRI